MAAYPSHSQHSCMRFILKRVGCVFKLVKTEINTNSESLVLKIETIMNAWIESGQFCEVITGTKLHSCLTEGMQIDYSWGVFLKYFLVCTGKKWNRQSIYNVSWFWRSVLTSSTSHGQHTHSVIWTQMMVMIRMVEETYIRISSTWKSCTPWVEAGWRGKQTNKQERTVVCVVAIRINLKSYRKPPPKACLRAWEDIQEGVYWV